jgi:hypothetical protein
VGALRADGLGRCVADGRDGKAGNDRGNAG